MVDQWAVPLPSTVSIHPESCDPFVRSGREAWLQALRLDEIEDLFVVPRSNCLGKLVVLE